MLLTEKRLRALIHDILLEGKFDQDKNRLSDMVQALPPHTGNPDASPASCFDLLINDRYSVRWVKWLAKHFLNVSSPSAGDSLEHALPSLAGYAKILQGISAKYRSNAPFKEAIDKLLRGRNPTEFENLTLREIDAIKGLYEPKFISDESWKRDKIGEFGKWALYFPTSQKNSVNIAGFDPITGESYVTWCTARTGGSNLFNLYAAQGMMLFYVINEAPRSNPRDPENRISIGFSNGILEATGKENGITVNGANKGLTLEDLSRIFGGNLGVNLNSRPMPDGDVDAKADPAADDQLISVELARNEHSKFMTTGGILGAALKRVELHGGTHPIVSEVEAAGRDVEKFDQMLKGLSTNEAADLASYILGHATEAVFERAAEHKSDKVKGVVARFPGAPLDVLEKLYRDAKSNDDKSMMREFSGNTSVPRILVDMLKDFFDADNKLKPTDEAGIRVLRAILSNRGLPTSSSEAQELVDLAQERGWDAVNIDATLDLDTALRSLINNNLALFNSKFASHIPELIRERKMNPDTLKLIWDKTDPLRLDSMGVYHFVDHPSIHSDVLYDIYTGHRFETTVCARIVLNPNADERTIRAIGADALLERTGKPSFLWGFRAAVARALVDNDLTPVEVLKYIADADVDDRYMHIKTAAEEKLKKRSPQVAESRRMALRIITELKKAQL